MEGSQDPSIFLVQIEYKIAHETRRLDMLNYADSINLGLTDHGSSPRHPAFRFTRNFFNVRKKKRALS